MAHIDVFKSWAETIRQDIDAFKGVLESDKAEEKARKLAGGALGYLVSKMDLIPDWNEGIGVIDDVMVLRVCASLSQDYDRGSLAAAVRRKRSSLLVMPCWWPPTTSSPGRRRIASWAPTTWFYGRTAS